MLSLGVRYCIYPCRSMYISFCQQDSDCVFDVLYLAKFMEALTLKNYNAEGALSLLHSLRTK